MTFHCQNCQQALDGAVAGQVVECPACHQPTFLPALDTVPDTREGRSNPRSDEAAPIPAWFYVFLAACACTALVTKGGWISVVIGALGCVVCGFIVRQASFGSGLRILGCIGVTAATWGLAFVAKPGALGPVHAEDRPVAAAPKARPAETKPAATVDVPIPARSMVHVNGSDGVVIWRQGERAFVAFYGGGGANGLLPAHFGYPNPAVRILGSQVLSVHGMPRVFAAEATEFPPPVTEPESIEVRQGDAVVVSGFVRALETPAPTRYSIRSKAVGVARDKRGRLEQVVVPLETPVEPGGIVTSNDQKLIGYVTQCMRDDNQFKALVSPLNIREVITPKVQMTDVALRGSDGDKAMFVFKARVTDPFGQLRSPRLRVRPIGHNEGFMKDPRAPLNGAQEAALEFVNPPTGAAGAHDKFVAAKFPFPKTPKQTSMLFYCQFVHQRSDGTDDHYTVAQIKWEPH